MRSASAYFFEDHTSDATDCSMTPSRASAGGASSAAAASGVGVPTVGSPGMLITEISERRRAGCSIAIVCTIIPPIDAPRTWARSIPRWSSNPIASAAISLSV